MFSYLRARYYDPAIGRFLSQDPLPMGNLYAYVGNNPVNWIDPTGLHCKAWHPHHCAQDAAEVAVEVVADVGQFVTDPDTLIAIGQAVGGGAIVIGCATGGPLNPLCAGGLSLYVLVSIWDYSRADSTCERVWSAVTSIAGGITNPLQPLALGVAAASGAGDAILCPTTVYSPGLDPQRPIFVSGQPPLSGGKE